MVAKDDASSGLLTINIYSGTNLSSMDFNGKSDPYVKFYWRNRKYKTHVSYKTLNPIWDCKFTIPYNPHTDEKLLHLKIWDEDTVGSNEFMGVVEIDLNVCAVGQAVQGKFPVKNGNGHLTVHLLYQNDKVSTIATPSQGDSSINNTQEQNRNWDIQAIKAILPDFSEARIAEALKQASGDRETALRNLLNIDVPKKNANPTSTPTYLQASHCTPNFPTVAPPSNIINVAPVNFPPTIDTKLQPTYMHPKPNSTYSNYTGQNSSNSFSQKQQNKKLHGCKKSLLIGINYFNTKFELKGCINDVTLMRNYLIQQGFPSDPNSMICLTDNNPNPDFQPTRRNILLAMRWLTLENKPGDIFFFHFSGHGSQVQDLNGDEEDGYDETILPVDYKSQGQIIDDDLHKFLVLPLQSGARLTAVMDCCRSGTGLDLSYNWDIKKCKWEVEETPYFVLGDVQLLSGCLDHQSSADVVGNFPSGAMTRTFLEACRASPCGHTFNSLIDMIRSNIKRLGFKQKPMLSSSQKFDLSRRFDFKGILPNANPYVGPVSREKKKKKKKKKSNFGGTATAVIGAVGVGLLANALFDF